MSSTNKTTNYELPIFVSSDSPKWLVDWNGAMNAIDSAIYQAKQLAETAGASASAVAADLASLASTVSAQGTSISTLVESLTTLTGAVNTITSLIGNGEPTTTDKTIIGAINELNAKAVNASAVGYDNTTSGLNADDAQEAIDEVAGDVATINSALSTPTTFTPTLDSTYVTAHTGYDNTCIKVGHLVFLNLCLDIVTNISNNTFVTIPEGFRPKYVQTLDLGETGNLAKINTDGTVTGYLPSSASHISINIVYFAD